MSFRFFFAGDIQNEDKVEFWAKEPVPRERVLCLYKHLAIPLLLPTVCPIYPRSRWIGGECSINWAGLLCSFHNLLKPLLSQWGAPNGLPATVEAPRPSATLHMFQVGWGSTVVPHGPQAEELHLPEPQDPGAEGWAGSAEYNPFLAADSERDLLDRATGNLDWQKVNASMKLRCAKWGDRDDVGAALVCMRSCMIPCLHLMHKLLEQAGIKWDRKQQSLVAQGKPRDYRVLAVARLTVETLSLLNGKFRDTVPALPVRHMTRRTRVLLFRMIATAGGAIQMLMGRDLGYPLRLFELLMTGRAEQVFQDAPCMYDELTTKLLMKFPDPKALTSLEGCAMVTSLAEFIALDIAGVEARHAAARRINSIRSCQANTMSLESLSSLTITRSMVKHRHDWLEARGLLPKAEARRRRNEKKKKKFHCGGGAWRAMLHQRKAGFGKSRELSAEYKRIKAAGSDEWRDLQELGRMGTISCRAGFPSFGARARKHARKKRLQIVAPELLDKEMSGVVAACKMQGLQEKKEWEKTMASLSEHAQKECNRLCTSGASAVGQASHEPAAQLAKSLSPSMLPLFSRSTQLLGLSVAGAAGQRRDQNSPPTTWPSMLSIECLPPVAEVVKDRSDVC